MRRDKGLTQKQLAQISGVSKSMICAIENAQKHPTVPVIYYLARALKVEVTQLFEYSAR
ncbi:helix-turn-helix domain-containing protein [Ruminiclostridium hungatei]|uniref:helix-turn-helix domain-containing protein n=1 Tax=Ruminiclostridium hungatei TaxID=48256 RepID=UPI0009AD1A44|nr:helix-turn-helix transcriptional regulator [Ruminiclostridium hungatei]